MGPHNNRPATAHQPSILILAAGASSRMRGGDKLLEQVDGQPQIRRAALAALSTGLSVWVALPPDRPARRSALVDLPLTLLTVGDAAKGMAAPIRAGLAALPPGPLLILLADLPEITGADLSQLIVAFATEPGLIHRATAAEGQPGHPVIFPDWARPALAQVEGDSGARDLLRAEAARTRLTALPGRHATTDLDTPEDWAVWRAAQTP